MKLTYPMFASPLLYLLCLASEALAAATMSAGCSSTCSSAGNNQICAKSQPVPSPGSHHTLAGTSTAADCSSQPAAVGVVPLLQITQSSVVSQPQSATWPSLLQMPESWGNN